MIVKSQLRTEMRNDGEAARLIQSANRTRGRQACIIACPMEATFILTDFPGKL
jgi:Fe-S-cluster-containing hydrogenase component 2